MPHWWVMAPQSRAIDELEVGSDAEPTDQTSSSGLPSDPAERPDDAATDDPADASVEDRRAWPILLAAGGAITLVRLLLSRDMQLFHLAHDEAAQLAIGRTLGGSDWYSYGNTYSPGFGTLLAPVYAITDDPAAAYLAALWFVAVLGGIATVLLALILRRIASIGTTWASGIALVVSLLPAVALHGTLVHAESLATVFVLAVLCVSSRLAAQGGPDTGVQLKDAGGKISVTLDGQEFTEYVYTGRAKPILYPIIGPGGVQMIRH